MVTIPLFTKFCWHPRWLAGFLPPRWQMYSTNMLPLFISDSGWDGLFLRFVSLLILSYLLLPAYANKGILSTWVEGCESTVSTGSGVNQPVVLFQRVTLPKTNNIAPKNGWLEYDRFLLGWPILMDYSSFRDCSFFVDGYSSRLPTARQTLEGREPMNIQKDPFLKVADVYVSKIRWLQFPCVLKL